MRVLLISSKYGPEGKSDLLSGLQQVWDQPVDAQCYETTEQAQAGVIAVGSFDLLLLYPNCRDEEGAAADAAYVKSFANRGMPIVILHGGTSLREEFMSPDSKARGLFAAEDLADRHDQCVSMNLTNMRTDANVRWIGERVEAWRKARMARLTAHAEEAVFYRLPERPSGAAGRTAKVISLDEARKKRAAQPL